MEELGIIGGIFLSVISLLFSYKQYLKNRQLDLMKLILENLDWLRQDKFGIKNLFEEYYCFTLENEYSEIHSIKNQAWNKLVYISNYIIKTNLLISENRLSKEFKTDLSNIVCMFYYEYLNNLYLHFIINKELKSSFKNYDFIIIFLDNHEGILRELFNFNTADIELMKIHYTDYIRLHKEQLAIEMFNVSDEKREQGRRTGSYTITTKVLPPFKEDNPKLFSSFSFNKNYNSDYIYQFNIKLVSFIIGLLLVSLVIIATFLVCTMLLK